MLESSDMYYENLFSKFEEAHLKYLVVGGLAVNLHGVPRMTADVDIAIAFDASNVHALLDLLAKLGYKPRAPVDPALLGDQNARAAWQTEKRMRAFSFANHANPLEELDVMLDTPFDFGEAYERRQVIAAGSLNVNVASLDDLIATKQGTGRAQDSADIAALELVKKLEQKEDHDR